MGVNSSLEGGWGESVEIYEPDPIGPPVSIGNAKLGRGCCLVAAVISLAVAKFACIPILNEVNKANNEVSSEKDNKPVPVVSHTPVKSLVAFNESAFLNGEYEHFLKSGMIDPVKSWGTYFTYSGSGRSRLEKDITRAIVSDIFVDNDSGVVKFHLSNPVEKKGHLTQSEGVFYRGLKAFVDRSYSVSPVCALEERVFKLASSWSSEDLKKNSADSSWNSLLSHFHDSDGKFLDESAGKSHPTGYQLYWAVRAHMSRR